MQAFSDNVTIVGIIPARGGSKGIENKNLLEIFGDTLVNRTVGCFRESRIIHHIVVSSDSEEILSSLDDDIVAVRRPDNLSGDNAPIELCFEHAVTQLNEQNIYPHILVWMQPNLPIRASGIVDEVVRGLLSRKDATSSVTCMQVDPRFRWYKKINEKQFLEPLFHGNQSFRRQDHDPAFLIDGSVVAFYVDNLSEQTGGIHNYLGENIVPIVQKQLIYSLELDEPEDLRILYQYLNTDVLSDAQLLDYFKITKH